jgi:hypothetical protein
MAKFKRCDSCGRESMCKPAGDGPLGMREWLCEDCYAYDDYVKPKESKRKYDDEIRRED